MFSLKCKKSKLNLELFYSKPAKYVYIYLNMIGLYMCASCNYDF